MFITIITDCADANVRGRQQTRARVLFDVTPIFVACPGTLDDAASLEASGNIVDMLDAAGDAAGIILANVAPRQGDEKHWGNGTPFGYFTYRNVLVFTTVTGYMLSLPHKLGLIRDYHVIDLSATLECMAKTGYLDVADVPRISASQFRSFDFLPRVAHWVSLGNTAVTVPLDLAQVPDVGARVWTIDNFGNVKTTLIETDLGAITKVDTPWGSLERVRALKDVTDGTAALTIGSSGIGTKRFAEIVIQGESAEKKLGICRGDIVLS